MFLNVVSPSAPRHTWSRTNSFFQQVQADSLAATCQTLQQLTSSSTGTGWILVLAPSYQLNKQVLEQCGINTQRILLINQKQIPHFDNLMRDALTCSTCEAVLSFLPHDAANLADYRYLASKYQTRLVNHCTTAEKNKPSATNANQLLRFGGKLAQSVKLTSLPAA